MGVIMHKQVNPDCTLGIWDIREDYETLLSGLELSAEEDQRLQGFGNHNRKLEWLSVRALARELTGTQTRIIYNNERKPFLYDKSFRISITHSCNFTAILLSKNRRVGIDLEYMSHRINKIRHKFIHESEKITGSRVKLIYHLYIHWCAKESLFKICDKQGLVFNRNMVIEPFVPADKGALKGHITGTGAFDESFELEYFRKDNYVIVWCCK
jgi:4'-phosphopantetheinyl transferase